MINLLISPWKVIACDEDSHWRGWEGQLPAIATSPSLPSMSNSYLAVLKALYNYETPQSEEELAIKEDQILFLLEKVDEEQVPVLRGKQ